jgi:hypothetical protein
MTTFSLMRRQLYGDVASRDISLVSAAKSREQKRKIQASNPIRTKTVRSETQSGSSLPAHKQLSEIHIPTAAAQ